MNPRRFALRRDAAAIALLALGLLVPALYNRFPVIFPDSGAYLGIAFGHEYAIDRSSIYGFFLKPFVLAVPTMAGLWLAIVFQVSVLAALLWPVARIVTRSASGSAIVLIITLLLTSLAWHAAQFMPDAFTAPTILLAWLAARRDPAADGAPLLWLAASVAALMHYTHIPLLLVASSAAILAAKALGLSWAGAARRFLAALVATAAVLTLQVGANTAIFGRSTLAPLGPLFLYARLNEDDLMAPWLAGHCGRDAPARLCKLAPHLPHNSQLLLWGGDRTPFNALVWHPAVDASRWPWIDELDQADHGAIAERPLAFALNSIRSGARQFMTFAPLDDECPKSCDVNGGGLGYALNKYRPAISPILAQSRQYQNNIPKAPIRLVLVTIASVAMLAFPLLLLVAWRRRDEDALMLLGAIGSALIANALLAGGFSDVHDRYQSRIIWLVPFAVLLLLMRWRSRTGWERSLSANAQDVRGR